MKRKILKYSLITLSVGTMATAPMVCLLSCHSSSTSIKDLSFDFNQNYIMPGDSLTAISKSAKKIIDNTNVEWDLIDVPYQSITISEVGVLSVPLDLQVDKPKSFQIKGTLKSDESLYWVSDIFLVPKTNKNMLGFIDNKISYVNRASESEDIELVKEEIGNKVIYRNQTPINLFTSDYLPTEYDSWIDFQPIIKSDYEPEMYFEYGHGEEQHSIRWSEYENGEMTTTIPMFNTISYEYPTDFIRVTFECDTTVSLELQLNIWTKKELLTQGDFAYKPTSEDDPNYVLPYKDRGDGAYYSNIRCQADKTASKQTCTFNNTIYCYRKPHEFLDLNFEVKIMDDDLYKAGAFGFTPIEDWVWTKHFRATDNYPYYTGSFSYWVEPSLLQGSYWKKTDLFKVTTYDSWTGRLCSYCDFGIDWYE